VPWSTQILAYVPDLTLGFFYAQQMILHFRITYNDFQINLTPPTRKKDTETGTFHRWHKLELA
jgi:hypothetical protein